MKKSILILLAAIFMVSFSSSAKTMSRKDCHQMLESFCQSQYGSMFDRYYFKNSLVIDNMKVYQENGHTTYELKGRHSFKTASKETYNDKYINILVREYNDRYEITLTLSKYFWGMSTCQVSSTRVYYL